MKGIHISILCSSSQRLASLSRALQNRLGFKTQTIPPSPPLSPSSPSISASISASISPFSRPSVSSSSTFERVTDTSRDNSKSQSQSRYMKNRWIESFVQSVSQRNSTNNNILKWFYHSESTTLCLYPLYIHLYEIPLLSLLRSKFMSFSSSSSSIASSDKDRDRDRDRGRDTEREREREREKRKEILEVEEGKYGISRVTNVVFDIDVASREKNGGNQTNEQREKEKENEEREERENREKGLLPSGFFLYLHLSSLSWKDVYLYITNARPKLSVNATILNSPLFTSSFSSPSSPSSFNQSRLKDVREQEEELQKDKGGELKKDRYTEIKKEKEEQEMSIEKQRRENKDNNNIYMNINKNNNNKKKENEREKKNSFCFRLSEVVLPMEIWKRTNYFLSRNPDVEIGKGGGKQAEAEKEKNKIEIGERIKERPSSIRRIFLSPPSPPSSCSSSFSSSSFSSFFSQQGGEGEQERGIEVRKYETFILREIPECEPSFIFSNEDLAFENNQEKKKRSKEKEKEKEEKGEDMEEREDIDNLSHPLHYLIKDTAMYRGQYQLASSPYNGLDIRIIPCPYISQQQQQQLQQQQFYKEQQQLHIEQQHQQQQPPSPPLLSPSPSLHPLPALVHYEIFESMIDQSTTFQELNKRARSYKNNEVEEEKNKEKKDKKEKKTDDRDRNGDGDCWVETRAAMKAPTRLFLQGTQMR